VMKYPMKNPAATDPATSDNPACQDKEVRRSFLHFLQGCLQMDPSKRWTPDQARAHPFLNEEVLPDGWTPPPAKRPTPPNQSPKPKEPSSRNPPDVESYYNKFCAAMMQHTIIDVASGNVLSELNDPLNPPPTDKTVRTHTATRGNIATSVNKGVPMPSSDSSTPSGSIGIASPPATTAAASSLSPFKIRFPDARGIPVSGGSALDGGQGDMSDHVSASANVATAAELRARMSGGSASRGLGERKKSHKPKRQPGVALAVETTSSSIQEQPFNMDGEDDETPSDSSDMASPVSPHDKRLPAFANVERDQPEEIAASWSYMPQNKNAGMPRVRPQQPELQETSVVGSRNAPLTFTLGGNSNPGSFGETFTPKHKSKSRHRLKDDVSDSNPSAGRSPLTALTFGSSVSPLAEKVETMKLDDSEEPEKRNVEVRVRTSPRKGDDSSSSKGKSEESNQ